MKKNIMMRLSALLLVAVLLTTCVISGTFAKYVENGASSDSAKVAKWGVEITVDTKDYKEYDGETAINEDTAVLTGDAHLLAPGSNIKFGTITVSGNPEVAVKVDYSATVTFTGWDCVTDYMPLVFVVNGTECKANSASDLKTQIENAINALDEEYAANTLNTNTKLEISCYWLFEGTGVDDAKDTVLGDNAPTVTIEVSCTVTQLDQYPSL